MTGWRKETGETSGPNSILRVLSASHVSEDHNSRASWYGPRPAVGKVVGAVEARVAEVLDCPRQPPPAVPADTLLPLDHDRDFKHQTPCCYFDEE
jgi:hypothetical protein